MSIRAVIALLLASFVAIPTLAIAEDGHEATPTRGGPSSHPGADRGGNGAPAGGTFALPASNAVAGDYVSFHYSDAGLSDYAAGGVKLFDATVTGGESRHREATAEADGAEIKIEGPNYSAHANDNPTAALRIETDGTVVLYFAAGAALSMQGNHVHFTLGDRAGDVFGTDLAIDGTQVRASEDVGFLLDAELGSFDVHRAEINNAVATKTVGAEISLYHGRSDEVTRFGNLTVTPMRVEVGNVTLVLAGHGFDGRVLVVNLDPALVANGTLSFRFDNASMVEAKNLSDALDPDAHGLKASYYVVRDKDGVQVIVSVPHYSVHTLTIASLIAEAPPSVIVGIAAGLVMLAAGGTVLFRRPKG